MSSSNKHAVVVISLEDGQGQGENSTKQDCFNEERGQKSTRNNDLSPDTPVPSQDENKQTDEKNTLEKYNCDDQVPVKSYVSTFHFQLPRPKQKVTYDEFFRKGRFPEKIVFMISVTTLVSLSLSLMNIHWFLPFYYAISTPILLVIRVVMYWKNKWQYFLFDFCYFANLFCYIYIWVVPANAETSVVLFAVANGPLAWATVLFRNALVFHDVDRMTSCYIHILPMVLSFGLRWYPEQMSAHWPGTFNAVYPTQTEYMFIWMFTVPLACFMLHSCLYLLIVFGICKPDESYLNSLRYLASRRNSWQGKILYACGDRCLLLTYTVFNLLYSTLSLLLALLFYKYYIAHVISISLVVLIVTWNGSTFYIDVFAAKASKPIS